VGRDRFSEYDDETTARCERALVTLLGDIGPWSERVYLAGGLAPRYLIRQLPDDIPAHVGTTDVDLIIGLARRHRAGDLPDAGNQPQMRRVPRQDQLPLDPAGRRRHRDRGVPLRHRHGRTRPNLQTQRRVTRFRARRVQRPRRPTRHPRLQARRDRSRTTRRRRQIPRHRPGREHPPLHRAQDPPPCSRSSPSRTGTRTKTHTT
jgi:hypothetical protein